MNFSLPLVLTDNDNEHVKDKDQPHQEPEFNLTHP